MSSAAARLLIIPAIDLAGGQVVRLTEGRRDSAETYAEDPVACAQAFERDGAERIHVVDLDGAFEGQPGNHRAIAAICAAVRVPVQVGGGLRHRAAVERVLELGARFVILGTVAAREPALFAALCAEHPGRIIAGIDARDGQVAVAGWAERTAMQVEELALRVAGAGAAAIIHTDIARDGTGRGVNAAASARLAEAVALPVIASGGVAGLEDLAALRATSVAGVVLGKALYEGRLTLAAALAAGRA